MNLPMVDESESYRNLATSRAPAFSEDAEIRALEKEMGLDQPVETTQAAPVQMPKPVGGDSALTQAAGGVLDGMEQTANTALDLMDWIDNYAAKNGIASQEYMSADTRLSFADKVIPKSDNPVYRLTRSVFNFVGPFAAASKIFKVGQAGGKLERLARAGAAGVATDFAAFDPREERVSNLVQEHPELRNPITAYLASDPDDTAVEGRFKQALEGMGLGALTDGIFLGVKGIKGLRLAKQGPEAAKAAEKGAGKEAAAAAEKAAQEPTQAVVQVGDAAKPPVGAPPIPAEAKAMKSKLDLTPLEPADGAKFHEIVVDEKGTKALNINLNKLDASVDLKKTIKAVAKQFEGEIDAARRGVVADTEVRKLADALDTDVEKLLDRGVGQAMSAEELLASRRILVASADNLLERAKAARGAEATDAHRVAFMEAFDAHRAIQAHVSGAVAEAGRALRSLRLTAGLPDDAVKLRAIQEAIQLGGGRESLERLADHVANLKDAKEISKVVNRSFGEKLYDAAMTVRINGMLSNPTTHFANLLVNTATVPAKIGERAVARGFSMLRGADALDGVVAGEAGATLVGAVQGFTDGLRLAYRAAKEGKASDLFQKVELPPGASRAIIEEQGVMGRATEVLAMGNLPTRALMASDEFFKSIHYRSELHALAVRDSARRGLKGDAAKENVRRILEKPPADLHLAATDEARLNTFTKPLEGGSQAVAGAIDKVPGLRLIFPFVRTPLNIFEYALQRTPGLSLASRQVVDDLKAGGLRRDTALSKLSFGAATMASAAAIAAQGHITGEGPANPETRRLLEQAGWRPNSVKIGDTYYSYDRMDPFGQLLGMAADYAELGGQLFDDREDQMDMVVATAAMIAGRNLTPEFLVDNLPPLLDALEDPKKWKKMVGDFAGSMVPASGLLRAFRRETDTAKRDATADHTQDGSLWREIMGQIRSQLPGFSSDLPPRMNLFGEVVHYDPGWGPDLVSPIATSKETQSPAMKEMVRLKLAGPVYKTELQPGEVDLQVSMPPRVLSIDGHKVELTPKEYGDFVKLAAGHELGMRETLEEALNSMVKDDFKILGAYRNNDQWRRVAMMKVINKYREGAAKTLVKKHPEIRARFFENIEFEKLLKGEKP